MKLKFNLRGAEIVKRLNRFTVRIWIDGKEELAWINNTGKLLEFLIPGKKCVVTEIEKPKKLRYRLVGFEDKGGFALTDTLLQMKIFKELVNSGKIPWLKERIVKKEPRSILSKGRFDFLTDKGSIIEVKSAVLRIGNAASYPDTPSERGLRHIKELAEVAKKGVNAYLVFIAALPDVEKFVPNYKVDPRLKDALIIAKDAGVKIKAVNFWINKKGEVKVGNVDLKVDLSGPGGI